jgi:hypothetical protein
MPCVIRQMRRRFWVAANENCARGIEAIAREEAACWLGMAAHRKNPRRVLAALRLLLSVNQ